MITPVRGDGQRGEQIHFVKGKPEIDDESHQVFGSLPLSFISPDYDLEIA